MRLVYSENLIHLPLPVGHRFPIGKYRLIYDALEKDHARNLHLSARASVEDILLVHDRAYVEACAAGTLSENAIRRLGFPWSPALFDRARRSVGGTLCALSWALQDGRAGHLAGGTHHAFRDRGEGFCVFNDIAVACAVARRDHGISRIAIVDLDVHQGNGTAAIFRDDPQVFTLSLHGQRNYPFHKEPSSLDVGLPDACDDTTFLSALEPALERVRVFNPELIFFQAGVDGLEGDRLGRLRLSHQGLMQRDRMVYSFATSLGVPLVVTLGGGYHRDVNWSVQAHVNVFLGMLGSVFTLPGFDE